MTGASIPPETVAEMRDIDTRLNRIAGARAGFRIAVFGSLVTAPLGYLVGVLIGVGIGRRRGRS